MRMLAGPWIVFRLRPPVLTSRSRAAPGPPKGPPAAMSGFRKGLKTKGAVRSRMAAERKTRFQVPVLPVPAGSKFANGTNEAGRTLAY